METKTFVKIQNEGEIEFGGLHLMGVSSKRGDSEKIGFFGSGNKYAIATLLRNNIPFRIFSGSKEVKIGKKEVMFRGKMYEQIIIDGETTSLTTSMGVDWENWFAIRELYCNAVDEGEATLTVDNKTKGDAGKTTIFVGLTDELSDFFKQVDRYILLDKENIIDSRKTQYGDVHILASDGEEFVAYRKGIRIFPKNAIKSLYWYNFSDIQINESRTYKYEHEVLERIASYLTVTKRKDVIENYLKHWKSSYEEGAKWEYVSDKLSETWHDILLGKRVYPENLAIRSGDFEGKHNSFIVTDRLAKKIAEQFEDIEVAGYGKKNYEEVEMTEHESKKINDALKSLSEIGYEVQSKIVLCITTTSDVIGWYDRKTDTIFLTRENLGTSKELKNTILEEHFHALGHHDGQREFVTFLIDELIEAKTTL